MNKLFRMRLFSFLLVALMLPVISSAELTAFQRVSSEAELAEPSDVIIIASLATSPLTYAMLEGAYRENSTSICVQTANPSVTTSFFNAVTQGTTNYDIIRLDLTSSAMQNCVLRTEGGAVTRLLAKEGWLGASENVAIYATLQSGLARHFSLPHSMTSWSSLTQTDHAANKYLGVQNNVAQFTNDSRNYWATYRRVHTLTLDAGGGSCTKKTYYGKGIIILPTCSAPTGKTFIGWADDANCSLVTTAYNAVSDATIYAIYRSTNTCNVTFVAGDGTTSGVSGNYDQLTLPTATPNNSNLYFVGWSDGILTYTAGTSYKVAKDVTLTAVYAPIYARFEVNDHSICSVNEIEGTTITMPSCRVKGDDLFLGWATSPNAIAPQYVQGENITISTPTTFYAVYSSEKIFLPISSLEEWQTTDSVVIVMESGNSDEKYALNFAVSSLIAAEIKAYSLENYSVGNAIVNPQLTSICTAVTGSNNTYYIKFDSGLKDIYLNLVSSSGTLSPMVIDQGNSPTATSWKRTWDSDSKSLSLYNANNTLFLCFKINHSIGSESATSYSPINQFTKCQDLSSADRTGMWRIYKQQDAYPIVLDANGGTCSLNMSYGYISLLPTATKVGYKHVGWTDGVNYFPVNSRYPQNGFVSATIHLRAVFEKDVPQSSRWEKVTNVNQIQYGDSIAFVMEDGGDGSAKYALTFKEGTVSLDITTNFDPTVVLPQQTFAVVPRGKTALIDFVKEYSGSVYHLRASESASATEGFSVSTTVSPDNFWFIQPIDEDERFKLQFGGNFCCYSNNASSTSHTCVHGSTNTVVQDKNLSEYDVSSKTAKAPGAWTIYKKVTTYTPTATFDAGELGTCSTPSITASTIVLPVVTDIADGYTFLGWTSDGKTLINSGVTISPKENIAFTARYGQPSVRFDLNNHGLWQRGFEDVYEIAGSRITLPYAVGKSGYRFMGWASTAEASSAQYQAGDIYPSKGTLSSNCTLYAVYSTNIPTTSFFEQITSETELIEGEHYAFVMEDGNGGPTKLALQHTPSISSSVDKNTPALGSWSPTSTRTGNVFTLNKSEGNWVLRNDSTNKKLCIAVKSSYYYPAYGTGAGTSFYTQITGLGDGHFKVATKYSTYGYFIWYLWKCNTKILAREDPGGDYSEGQYVNQFKAGRSLKNITEEWFYSGSNYHGAIAWTIYRKTNRNIPRVQFVTEGEGHIADKTGVIVTTPTLAETPVPANSKFDYWEDFSGKQYGSGVEFSPATDEVLTAIYTKFTATFTVDSEKGSCMGATIQAGQDIVVPNCASNQGWKFLGWSTNPDATVADATIKIGGGVNISVNTTYYAIFKQWKELIINEAEDNTEAIATYYNQTVDQVSLIRTLSCQDYGTFCVPFDFSANEMESSCSLYVLNEVNTNNNIMTISFVETASVDAGQPCLILPQSTIVNPIFYDKSIQNVTTRQETTNVDFIGVYGIHELQANPSILILGSGHLLYHIVTDGYMKGLRGYFQTKNNTSDVPVRISVSGKGITTYLDEMLRPLSVSKFLDKGHLFIQRNGHLYDGLGQQVR